MTKIDYLSFTYDSHYENIVNFLVDNIMDIVLICAYKSKLHIAYGRGALFMSILRDMSGIEERRERKQCRSGNNLNYYCWAYG